MRKLAGIGLNDAGKLANELPIDEEIYKAIGKQLQLVSGFNSLLGMKQLKIGSMNIVIYPVGGSFEDWAYAASWVPYLTPKCKAYNYLPYP